jgi:hypothetical protein
VQSLIQSFGPDSVVWGSDWPFLRAPERIDYGPLLKLIEQLVPEPSDWSKPLWHTPNRLFGFTNPPRGDDIGVQYMISAGCTPQPVLITSASLRSPVT